MIASKVLSCRLLVKLHATAQRLALPAAGENKALQPLLDLLKGDILEMT
jgi:hypothetical protein